MVKLPPDSPRSGTRPTTMNDGGSVRSVKRYRFGPLDRRGLLAGWRGGQAATVGAGLVVAVGALRTLPVAAALAVAVVAVGSAVAVATWPIAGRTGDEWFPDVARHGARVVTGRRWRSGPAAAPATSAATAAQHKGPFSSLRILQVDAGGDHAAVRMSVEGRARPTGRAQAAVVHDPAERTYTAVMPASGPGFVLLGTDDRDRRVSGWAAALGTLARQGTPVHRVQWVARTLPGDPPHHRTDSTRGSPAGAQRGNEVVRGVHRRLTSRDAPPPGSARDVGARCPPRHGAAAGRRRGACRLVRGSHARARRLQEAPLRRRREDRSGTRAACARLRAACRVLELELVMARRVRLDLAVAGGG